MKKRMVNDGGSSRVLKMQMNFFLKFVDSRGHLCWLYKAEDHRAFCSGSIKITNDTVES